LKSFPCLDFLHLLNVSCTSLLLQHVAFGLNFPLANLDDLVSERCCDLFESLVSCLREIEIRDNQEECSACNEDVVVVLANVRKSSWAGFCDSNVLKNSQPQSTGTPKKIRGSAKDSVLRKTIPVGDLVEKADILRVVLAW